jgi:capsid assembly protease
MNGLLTSTALWAMHDAALASLLHDLRQSPAAVQQEALEQRQQGDPIREGAVLIMRMIGAMAPSGMFYAGCPTDIAADRIAEAAADSRIGAIVLDMRSPGGTVWGTRELGDAVFAAREQKPVVAVANPIAFSAAYWVASQAGAFYASSSGEVGSVGVRTAHVDWSKLEADIGIVTTLIASHPDKIFAHPFGPLSDNDRAVLQAGVDESYSAFQAAVARGRAMSKADVAGVHGQGLTFSAQRAAASGAIDGVMTLRDVVAKYSSSRSRLDLMRRQAALLEQVAGI